MQQESTTGDHYSIRPAMTADLDQLVVMMLALQDHLEASNPALWRMTPEARGRLRAQIGNRLTAVRSCARVADHVIDGVVGMIFGRIVTSNRYTPPRAGVIDQAYVREDHRRSGVGTLLVKDLYHFFEEGGAGEITLRYAAGNDEAAGFWASLGFQVRIITCGASLQSVQSRLSQGRTV